jgi:hypothetical protein
MDWRDSRTGRQGAAARDPEPKSGVPGHRVRGRVVVNEQKLLPPAETPTVFNVDVATHEKPITEERLDKFRVSLGEKAGNGRAVQDTLGYVRPVNEEQAELSERQAD